MDKTKATSVGTVRPTESRKRRRTNEDDYERLSRPVLGGSMTRILIDTMKRNGTSSNVDEKPPPMEPCLAFYSTRQPSGCLKQYVMNLVRYSGCSIAAFVTSLIFLDRVVKKGVYYRINKLNLHRMILASVCVASKLLDGMRDLRQLALVGGCTSGELCYLELIFLDALDYDLTVKEQTYRIYERRFQKNAHPEERYRQNKFC